MVKGELFITDPNVSPYGTAYCTIELTDPVRKYLYYHVRSVSQVDPKRTGLPTVGGSHIVNGQQFVYANGNYYAVNPSRTEERQIGSDNTTVILQDFLFEPEESSVRWSLAMSSIEAISPQIKKAIQDAIRDSFGGNKKSITDLTEYLAQLAFKEQNLSGLYKKLPLIARILMERFLPEIHELFQPSTALVKQALLLIEQETNTNKITINNAHILVAILERLTQIEIPESAELLLHRAQVITSLHMAGKRTDGTAYISACTGCPFKCHIGLADVQFSAQNVSSAITL
jgi:hypothetical protein